MRTVLQALAMAAIAVAVPSLADSQNREDVVREIMDSGEYAISIDKMKPLGGGIRNLTSDYYIRIGNDSLYSCLPYAGVAYNIPYGGGEGLVFDAPVSGYDKVEKNDKTIVTVKVRNSEDSYTYTITVFSNGNASVAVQPVNRQFISFSGSLLAE